MAVQVEKNVVLLGRYEHGWIVRCHCGREVVVPYGTRLVRGTHEFECGSGHPVKVTAS